MTMTVVIVFSFFPNQARNPLNVFLGLQEVHGGDASSRPLRGFSRRRWPDWSPASRSGCRRLNKIVIFNQPRAGLNLDRGQQLNPTRHRKVWWNMIGSFIPLLTFHQYSIFIWFPLLHNDSLKQTASSVYFLFGILVKQFWKLWWVLLRSLWKVAGVPTEAYRWRPWASYLWSGDGSVVIQVAVRFVSELNRNTNHKCSLSWAQVGLAMRKYIILMCCALVAYLPTAGL